MKSILRIAVFLFISLNIAQYIITGYNFGHSSSVLLFITALTVLIFFIRPLLRLVSLPVNGPSFIFMTFILIAITSHVLTLFIPQFSMRSTEISELIIFGFVLPSKRLSVIWSNVFSSLLITVLMWFFSWLCDCEKR